MPRRPSTRRARLHRTAGSRAALLPSRSDPTAVRPAPRMRRLPPPAIPRNQAQSSCPPFAYCGADRPGSWDSGNRKPNSADWVDLSFQSKRESPIMNRALRRSAPVALTAAAAALVLAGCAGGPSPDASETPSAAADCMELESGSLSDGVTVEGDFGGSPTATFTTPLTAETLERTVAIEGDGDVTVAGDDVNAVVSAFSGTTGEQVFSQPATITAGDDTVFEAFLAGIDCVPAGSRTVTVAPASTLYGDEGNETIGVAPGETLVIVVDVQEPLKPAEWKTDVPDVKFGAEGEAPTVTLPATPPPAEYQLKVLEE